jgi:hypothetical protein
MRVYSKLLALTAGLTFLLGILALPLQPANAQTSGGFGSAAVHQVTAISRATVYVNGLSAGVGTKYTDTDKLTVNVSLGGSVTVNRTASGVTTTKTITSSITSVTFQAIWIGDD